MFLRTLKMSLLFGMVVILPLSIYATSLEEFAAMQGGRKITNNPASAVDLQGGIIDANLFSFGSACSGSYDDATGIKSHANSCSSPTETTTGFGTNTGVLGVTYASDGSGRDAFVDMTGDWAGTASATDIQYTSRDSRASSWTLGYGWDYLAFATTAKWDYEWYSKGGFSDPSGTGAVTQYATESIYRTETSNVFALALPPISGLGDVSIGVRNNTATRYHEYDPYGLISSGTVTPGTYKLSGQGTEHSQDLGILIPNINDTFGFGYVQRNFSNKAEGDFKMTYEYISTTTGATTTWRTLDYSTPPFSAYGITWKFKAFTLPTMLLFDSGGGDGLNENAAGFNVNYDGTHLSYGVRNSTYTAFQLKKETIELKFSWAQFKVTTYTFYVKSGESFEEVGKLNIPTVSISLYFDSTGFHRPVNKYCNSASQADCFN